MKHTLLTLLLSLLISLNITGQTATPPTLGDGTADNPYQIENLEHLYWLRQNFAQWQDGLYYIQTADIDAGETHSWGTTGWNSIGNSGTTWKGSYDGQGFVIKNLYVRRTTTDYVGLFGNIEDAIIKNLGLVNLDITGRQYTGGLSGRAVNSVIDSCFTTGGVKGTSYVGGLTGSTYGINKSFCYSTCHVTGEQHVGGLVGSQSYGQTQKSFSTGIVRGNSNVGGFVGWNAGGHNTQNCYSLGRVLRTSGTHSAIGSFAGYNTSAITYSYSTGRVTYTGATNPNNKGFIGTNEGSGSFLRNFFDTETSSQSSGTGAAGRTTAEMQLTGTYTGWNFATLWGLVNGDYPFLMGHSFEAIAPSGEGTPEEPYHIENLNNIYWLSLNSAAWDKHFEQTQNIDATLTNTWFDGRGLLPIGNNPIRFTGIYNGLGHTIDGLHINRPSENYIGFFGYTTGATIRDLGLTNVYISGDSQVGALAGSHSILTEATSLIEYCFTTGEINGSTWVGGLVGYTRNSQIQDSYSFCNITRLSGASTSLGAFAGLNHTSEFTHNYAIGSVVFKGENNPTDKGFLGSDVGTVSYTENFFDNEFSNQINALGAAGKSTADMQNAQTFSSWDFGTWVIDPEVNSGYPFLLPYRAQIETLTVENITSTGAQSGGNVVMDNGFEVTQRGVVWNSAPNPSLENHGGITTDGAGTGEFTSDITGLESGTEYFVRAYAINEKGTSYGAQLRFVSNPLGDGSSEDPFQIANLIQLKWIEENSQHWDKHFIQIADIDASSTAGWNEGAGWNPIGFFILWNNNQPFTGNYDGQNHTISSLTINKPTFTYQGLFGYTTGAVVHNLVLENPAVTASNTAGSLLGSGENTDLENIEVINAGINGASTLGALAGRLSGSNVANCQTSGSVVGSGGSIGGIFGSISSTTLNESHTTCAVSGTSNVGGLTGQSSGGSFIGNCSSTSGIVNGNTKTGGLVGNHNNSRIENSFRTGDITSSIQSSHEEMGGLVGINTNGAVIIGSWAIDGTLKRTGGYANHWGMSQAGGLVGLNSNATIINSYSTFNLTHTHSGAGGLVGQNNNGLIARSYATGYVKGTSSLGGLTGLNTNSGIITDSYSRGSITIKEAWAYSQWSQGGLVGFNNGGSIHNCYATGSISYEEWGMPSPSSKGLVGTENEGIYHNNYFSLTSNQTSSTGATALTVSQMQEAESFEGWDFNGIWGYETGVNNNFPLIDALNIPVVITTDVTDITNHSATINGNVLFVNPISTRGFVWSNLPNPDTTNNVGMSNEGDGTGPISTPIEDLSPGTTWYVKAYAQNDNGFAFGTQLVFTTLANEPELITKDVTNITETEAQSGGIIQSDGGAEVTARGIVWSTTENPTIESNEGITQDGEGMGEYVSEMTGLITGITYYVRAWATNSTGTSYGDQKSFETTLPVPTFTLTLSAIPAEGGSATLAEGQQTGPYEESETVNVKAVPSEGYEFVKWTLDDFQVSDEENFAFTMPAEDVELVAHFSEIPEPVYSLTLTAFPATGGDALLNPEQAEGPYEEGAVVDVLAVPAYGYEFVNWTRDGVQVATLAEFAFTMPAEHVELVANFSEVAQPTFTLTLNASPAHGGTALLHPEQLTGPYEEGAVVDVLAIPADGYEFVHWMVENEQVSTQSEYAYTMPANNTEITAVFQLVTHTNNDWQSSLRVYPNPFSDIIYLETLQQIEGVTIADLTGRIVRQSHDKTIQTINTSDFKNGLYILSVTFSDGKRKVFRIIKR